MSLEHRLKEKRKFVLHRTPSENVIEEVKKGKKFIVVNDNFDYNNIPLGYMLIDMRYKNGSFKSLVPQNLLFFLANPGEGNIDDALDEIGDFYDNVQDFEDELLEENGESVQGTNWAVTARNAYETYLINKLTSPNGDDADKPEWHEETLKSLKLDDEYVARRVRAIAAVSLGKTAEQVKDYNLGDVLKHVTINKRKVEQLTRNEFDQVTCWASSHYNLKEEFMNNSDVEYNIERRHDESYRVGQKITKKKDVQVLDAKIPQLENEIEQHNSKNGRHDRMLRRMYANLRYIAKEDPQKQLEIKPIGEVQNETC